MKIELNIKETNTDSRDYLQASCDHLNRLTGNVFFYKNNIEGKIVFGKCANNDYAKLIAVIITWVITAEVRYSDNSHVGLYGDTSYIFTSNFKAFYVFISQINSINDITITL